MKNKINVISILSLSTILLCSGCSFTYEEAVDYLSKFEQTKDVVVSDYHSSFIYDGKTYNVKEAFPYDNFEGIARVTKDEVFVYSKPNELNGYEQAKIYKSDYSLNAFELVYEFNKDINSSRGFVSDELFYHKYNEKNYIYDLTNKELKEVTDTFIVDYKKENNKFTIESTVDIMTGDVSDYSVYFNKTDEKKIIYDFDLFEVEQASYFNQQKSFSISKGYAVDENVFLITYTKGCSVIFKYDYDNEEITYYTWIDISSFEGKERLYYFI